ncbi:SusC/RagA family TonB-linked outer membrane protein [Marinifilum sp.]|uniref:SusC/RagA family TonB-linked outer membrane protein n=1 Tax=Marinifilum sp. TaxID=2033137 RepID=UPI003BA97C41
MKKKFNLEFFHKKKPGLPVKLLAVVCLILSLNLNSWAVVAMQGNQIVINESNINLEDLIWKIKEQSGYKFIYNTKHLQNYSNLSVDKKGTVDEILNSILLDTKLTYELKNNAYVLKLKDTEKKIEKTEQEKAKIRGKITDEKGNVLPGVSVLIKGSYVGTTSNIDGLYTISVLPGDVLVFSFVGMESQEVKIEKNADINIVLKEQENQIGEVTVTTGYQEIKKERMIGSSAVITSTELRNKGFTNIEQALEGTIAGLTTISSGRPGEDAQITIRGVNSLSGSTSPMWIVDGMPMMGEVPNVSDGAADLQSAIFTTGIGNLTPDDIESITVLKDAAATAIYGARAANGVIVIKTKSGTEGKTYFNVTSNYSIFEKPEMDVQMMNTAQKIEYEKRMYNDFGRYNHLGRVFDMMKKVDYGTMSQVEFDSKVAELEKINTDWFDEIFRAGTSSQTNVSMQGGTEKTQYYASGVYLTNKGTEPNNKYQKMGMNLKLTHNPSRKVRIQLGLNGTMRKDRSTASRVRPLQYAMYANPYEKPYNDDGTYAYDLSYNLENSDLDKPEELAWGKFNIFHDLNNNTAKSRYIDLQTNLKFEYEIVPGLMYTSQATYNVNATHSRSTEGANTYTNFKNHWLNATIGEVTHDMVDGALSERTGYADSYTWRNSLSYNKEINNMHFINIMTGQEILRRDGRNFSNYSPVFDELHGVTGFPNLTDIKPEDLNVNRLGGTGEYTEKISSFFAIGSYSFMDRYVFNGSIRYDGSDIIGNDNQFTPLWNVGFRWNLHNEDFINSRDFFNELSIRAGYGFTGSIDKNARPNLVMYFNSAIEYDGVYVPTSFDYPSPSVKWQTKEDINIGLDVAMLKNRFELTVNYYHNTTDDVLDRRKLAYSSGRGSVIENVADLINKGWEFQLSTTNIRTQDLTWITRFNVAINDNKVKTTFFKSLNEVPATNSDAFVEGYPVRAWYGFKFARVDEATGNTIAYLENGGTFDMDEIYSKSHKGLEPPLLSYLGEAYPPISGGISTTLRYKRLTLSARGNFYTGHKIKSFNTTQLVNGQNRYIKDINRWRQPGDVTDVPAYPGHTRYAYNTYLFDTELEDGDYFRLRYVTLGYNFPPELLKKIGFKTMRLSATANNLLTLTKYNGIDPALMGGFGYPNSSNYTLTLNLGF